MFGNHERIFATEERKANSVGMTLKRLVRQFRPYWLALIVVALLLVVSTVMQVSHTLT